MSADSRRPRILLLGSTGQVAQALARVLPALGQTLVLSRSRADFSVPYSLRSVIREAQPDAIVVAAAYTAVDKAESEPELAARVNAESPTVIAEEAEALGASVVHYSTDYVFDGGGARAWEEGDSTGPLSVYGRTKLDGERGIAQARRHLIFRTSWVVSSVGTNFVRTMLRLAGERTELKVVHDQHGVPTTSERIAAVTSQVLGVMRDAAADDPRWGVNHLASAGETTWHGVAEQVITRAWERGAALNCRPRSILPIPSSAYPTSAPRPLNSCLSTVALRLTFGASLPDWKSEVNGVVDTLCPERNV